MRDSEIKVMAWGEEECGDWETIRIASVEMRASSGPNADPDCECLMLEARCVDRQEIVELVLDEILDEESCG